MEFECQPTVLRDDTVKELEISEPEQEELKEYRWSSTAKRPRRVHERNYAFLSRLRKTTMRCVSCIQFTRRQVIRTALSYFPVECSTGKRKRQEEIFLWQENILY